MVQLGYVTGLIRDENCNPLTLTELNILYKPWRPKGFFNLNNYVVGLRLFYFLNSFSAGIHI